jgi:hypothetical protein
MGPGGGAAVSMYTTGSPPPPMQQQPSPVGSMPPVAPAGFYAPADNSGKMSGYNSYQQQPYEPSTISPPGSPPPQFSPAPVSMQQPPYQQPPYQQPYQQPQSMYAPPPPQHMSEMPTDRGDRELRELA